MSRQQWGAGCYNTFYDLAEPKSVSGIFVQPPSSTQNEIYASRVVLKLGSRPSKVGIADIPY